MLQANTLDVIRTVFSGFVLVGFVIGFFQLRAALRSSRASVLLRLIQEWSSQEVYAAVRYVHDLRAEWKKTEPDSAKWGSLADQWVREHVSADPSANDPFQKRLAGEWWMRRTASQFLSKMGYLMTQRYITANDLFGVVPEAGRLLAVLGPIERSVARHFREAEKPIAEWDVAFYKIGFGPLMSRYEKWFKRSAARQFGSSVRAKSRRRSEIP